MNSEQQDIITSEYKFDTALAEVIESTITTFTAECCSGKQDDNHSISSSQESSNRVRFGSFLRIESQEEALDIYAIVFNIVTAPVDSIHKPVALGMTRERLREEQPHIFSLLRTRIHAAIVAHKTDDRLNRYLPPRPPNVHDFVYQANEEEVSNLARDFEFLRILTHINLVPQDELIAAAIREACRQAGKDEKFLFEAGKTLSNIFRNDYDRLLTILRKLRSN